MMRPAPLLLVTCAVFSIALPTGAVDGELSHDWHPLRQSHWQIASACIEEPSVTDEHEGTRGQCPIGMVMVRGNMKTGSTAESVETLEDAACLAWEPKTFPGRCLRFDEAKWASVVRDLPSTPMRFCIDRFEYPNARGAYPIVAVTWLEARELCAESGK